MKPKVLIINTPFLKPFLPPLGCAYIKSTLRHAGYQVNVIDLNLLLFNEIKKKEKLFWEILQPETNTSDYHKNKINKLLKKYSYLIDKEIDKIKQNDYQYVLFSIYLTQKYFALKIAKRVKKINKNIKIIFGGPECFKNFCFNDKNKDLMKKNDSIDYHVYSAEGEKIIVELLDEIENNKEVKTGGVIKRVGNQIIENPESELIKDINTIPFPSWEGFNLNLYATKGALPIISSRGCINNCTFCNEGSIWPIVRIRKAENIFAEIKRNYEKFKFSFFIFNDTSINNSLIELEKLCDLIINSNINIGFRGQANFNSYLNKNLLKKMNQAGCTSITFGFESGSQNVVNLMNKRFDVKKSEEVIKNAKEAGIKIILNFMFGFPGETEENFQETLDYLKRNKEYIDEVCPMSSFTSIHKGTTLDNNLEKFNVKFYKDYPLFWETKDEKNNILIRLNRFERFCQLTKKLGIKTDYGSTKHKNRDSIINDYNIFNKYHKKLGLNNRKIIYGLMMLSQISKSLKKITHLKSDEI